MSNIDRKGPAKQFKNMNNFRTTLLEHFLQAYAHSHVHSIILEKEETDKKTTFSSSILLVDERDMGND